MKVISSILNPPQSSLFGLLAGDGWTSIKIRVGLSADWTEITAVKPQSSLMNENRSTVNSGSDTFMKGSFSLIRIKSSISSLSIHFSAIFASATVSNQCKSIIG